MVDEATFKTTDFYTIAVLFYKGFELLEVTPLAAGSRVKEFHFKDTPDLRATVLSYINGKLTGNIRDFKNAIETTKDMIHNS